MSNVKLVVLENGKTLIGAEAEEYIVQHQDTGFKIETHEVDIYTVKCFPHLLSAR